MVLFGRVAAVAAATVLVFAVSGCASTGPSSPDAAQASVSTGVAPTTGAPTAGAPTAEAPTTVGSVLSDARTALQALGFTVTAEDAVEDRVILMESNWIVAEQAVAGTEVTLHVRKVSDPTEEELEQARKDAEKKEKEDAKKKAAEEKAEVEKNKLTLGQRNAISKAESYLDYTSFSRKGLIEQLKYEGFSAKESALAVDYLDVDWNEQAAKKAQDYLDFTSFSRQGLIDQLVFEGFNVAQAKYGASAVGY